MTCDDFFAVIFEIFGGGLFGFAVVVYENLIVPAAVKLCVELLQTRGFFGEFLG